MSDEDLVKQTLDGDDQSFEELVRRYKGHVMNIAWNYARDAQEVDDMAQETFVKAYFSLSTYRFEAPFQHWLSRIASRSALDFLRKRYRRRESFFSDLSPDSPERLNAILERAKNLEVKNLGIERDMKDFLESVLQELSPQDQWLMRAVQMEELKLKEIGQMTGWGISMVKVRLFRVRRKMKNIIQKRFKNGGLHL